MGDDSYGYAYDPLGNRTVTAENTETTEYVVNNLNQYTNILCVPASLRLNHDADGNLLTNGVWSFTWDAENRLVSACSNNVLLVTNTYDPRSRRIRKEVSVWDPQLTAYRSQSTASFLWDNWNVIREVRQSNIPSFQSSTNYYTWGVDLSGSLQGAGGVGGLLAVTTTDTNSGTSTNYYPCYDANGNVTAYLDAGGSVVAGFEYDAFGATVAASGPLGDAFTHRFSTKPFDAETGSSYYGYRHYGPEWGGWFSRDPIEEQGGLNLYGFAGNNLIDDWDVLGLFDKNKFKLVTELKTWDHTNCPEFGANGGTVDEYLKAFTRGDGRLSDLGVPVKARPSLGRLMVGELNMTKNYYYSFYMALMYWKYDEIMSVAKTICSSCKQKKTQHVIEMDAFVKKYPKEEKVGFVKQYDDKAATTGLKIVTPPLPASVGPVITYECVSQ